MGRFGTGVQSANRDPDMNPTCTCTHPQRSFALPSLSVAATIRWWRRSWSTKAQEPESWESTVETHTREQNYISTEAHWDSTLAR